MPVERKVGSVTLINTCCHWSGPASRPGSGFFFFSGFSNLTLPLETGLVRLFSRAEVREVTTTLLTFEPLFRHSYCRQRKHCQRRRTSVQT